jgi:hypothetical protein
MAEANASLHLTQLRASMPLATNVRAQGKSPSTPQSIACAPKACGFPRTVTASLSSRPRPRRRSPKRVGGWVIGTRQL